MKLRYMAAWLLVQSVVIMAVLALILDTSIVLMTLLGLAGGSVQAVVTYFVARGNERHRVNPTW